LKHRRYQFAEAEQQENDGDERLGIKDFDKWLVRFKKDASELFRKAEQLEERIYQINKPQPHKYEIIATR
jgi:hypothetical protein